jgi:hypothetical protein
MSEVMDVTSKINGPDWAKKREHITAGKPKHRTEKSPCSSYRPILCIFS